MYFQNLALLSGAIEGILYLIPGRFFHLGIGKLEIIYYMMYGRKGNKFEATLGVWS